MKALIKNYEIGRGFVCAFSENPDTDRELLEKRLNILHYEKGSVSILPEELTFSVDEKWMLLFESLKNRDVLEINDNGAVSIFYSSSEDDTTLFFTSSCNSNCVMCPSSDLSRRSGEKREKQELLELLNYLPASCRHITITGGEPLLLKTTLFEVLEHIKRDLPNTEVLVLTNGRGFSVPGYAEALAASAPRNCVIGIPIHGDNEALHDSITRASGSFRQTVEGIKRLLAYSIPVEIRIVVSKLNADRIKDIAEFVAEQFPNAFTVHFIGLEMLGNASVNSSFVWISNMEAVEAIEPAVDVLLNNRIDFALYNYPLCSVPEKLWPACRKSISEYKRYYSDKCDGCIKKAQCGGIFSGSRRFAEADLKPIKTK